jgi:hypothetical protein
MVFYCIGYEKHVIKINIKAATEERTNKWDVIYQKSCCSNDSMNFYGPNAFAKYFTFNWADQIDI